MKASYLVQLSSNPLRNRQILLRTSVCMRPTSWYLWTRVRLIVRQHIVGGPGQYGARRQLGRPSFVEVEGEQMNVLWSDNIWLRTGLSFIRFSVLPTLSLDDGILHCDIVEGAFNSGSFYTFIECTLDRMQPFPTPNSVIVMDNCRIHKHPEILELIESQ